MFRIAHNAAIDHLRRTRREPFDDVADADVADVAPDPAITRLALRTFLVLPVRQRSAVILKDVLGLSLEEIAAAMDATVMAVKAALVRGRAALRASAASDEAPATSSAERVLLARYVSLFNARDWPGLQAPMLAEDARLDLVSQAQRRGREVGQYFGRYDKLADLRLEPGVVDGRPAIFVYEPAAAPRPSYFILLEWRDGRVVTIRDYRYVTYVAAELP